ncbi:MAG: hypothetical protein AB7O66_13180 [Limisphaerales bacterium]
MTPQCGSFELALMNIRRCLVDPPMEDRADALRRAAFGVDRFVESIIGDPERTRALIATVRAVRDSPGPGSTVAETRLMQSLGSIAFECIGGLTKRSPAPDAELRREVLRELAGYAVECLGFRRRRDSFGGRRRSIAFEILAWAAPHVEVSEAVRIARSIVQSGDGNDFHGAIEFLLEQFQDRDEAPDEELVGALFGVAERTRSRSIAVGALNFLVETGAINELQALDRIDEWKERNQPRG